MKTLRTAFCVLAASVALALCASAAPSVTAKDGNIYFTDAQGAEKQLTTTGHDTDPVLSPDGKWIVFVRKVEGKKIATGSDDVEPTELWQIRADGKEPTVLLRCRESKGEKDHPLAGFERLQFSANGKLVYFVSPQWATSGAVHVVDTTNAKEHFICAGSDVKVVRSGEYKDCLLINQHRYYVGGGSYDWYWLFRPDGREVGPIGEDTSTFEATYGPD